MEDLAIDFRALRRAERRKRQGGAEPNNKTASSRAEHKKQTQTLVPPTWKGPLGSLDVKIDRETCYDSSKEDRFFSNNHRQQLQPPKRIQYFSSVLSMAQQAHLSDWLHQLPEGETGLQSWKKMTYGKRRVAMFVGRPFPQPLEELAVGIEQAHADIFAAPMNHVLLNDYYERGQGIMPHTDGPSYHPGTATLSLNSDVLFRFAPRHQQTTADDDDDDWQLVLQAGSLVVFSDDAYSDYCHSIAANVEEEWTNNRCLNAPRGTHVERGSQRFSLTFRHKYDLSTMES